MINTSKIDILINFITVDESESDRANPNRNTSFTKVDNVGNFGLG